MRARHLQAPGLGWLASALLTACSSENSFIGKDSEAHDPIEVEETFIQESLSKVDILWVIDDTSSMRDEQEALQGAFADFASGLEALDLSWQMGFISTDISDASAGVLLGDPWILTPDLDDPVAAIELAASVGTDGEAPEAGLGAAWLALSEPLLSTSNRAFRRDDAALHVIVVSDADDSSETVLGPDPVGSFSTFLAGEAERSGQDARLSAVVGDVPSGCTWEGGAALPGERYAEVASASGGTVDSICSPDLSEVTAALADLSVSWPVSFPLQAEPAADTVRVWVDDVRQTTGFSVDLSPPTLIFDDPPAGGAEIRVSYEVAE